MGAPTGAGGPSAVDRVPVRGLEYAVRRWGLHPELHHIAFGSIRMEPVFMILGQSAATAAAMALDDKADVQSLSYDKLRKRLLAAFDAPDGAHGGVHLLLAVGREFGLGHAGVVDQVCDIFVNIHSFDSFLERNLPNRASGGGAVPRSPLCDYRRW